MSRVITIDGPAGVGKSTAALGLARSLGWFYLNSGALYRAVAWIGSSRGMDLHSADARAEATRILASAMRLERLDDGSTRIVIDGSDPGDELRRDEIARLASFVARDPHVRERLHPLQREARSYGDLVAEGRDMGTVVFPDAQLKFFMTADIEVRAGRRSLELRTSGRDSSVDIVRHEMVERDERDRTRSVSPLRAADDAVMIDTTHLGITEVLDELLAHVADRLGDPGREREENDDREA